MDYYSFCELQPGDLVAANRGRFKGRMFEVESVDYDEETARVVWSTANEGVRVGRKFFEDMSMSDAMELLDELKSRGEL